MIAKIIAYREAQRRVWNASYDEDLKPLKKKLTYAKRKLKDIIGKDDYRGLFELIEEIYKTIEDQSAYKELLYKYNQLQKSNLVLSNTIKNQQKIIEIMEGPCHE